ncbi:DUF4391 domain-containing protein [Tenacibaculum finnmarkense]|uniref:DUF4391 domain-containing protein n=1 Tax=Tenacibaculum finnmarkense TaxID=2781243 RepID=UPI000C4CFC9D|nr:DUF4391 domain-containing protein [Tenacibaculum finnmarkense]MCD8439952.1 DUF4391 domain-containing protein [Tenacibaculum finnmarkense genomovar ulcerans]MCG8720856.1 DUF4391 domain-containing protein [Tenacibaculum finnmarkense]SOS54456.1 conserved hypothetical protein [Tenacibaculum finnmarkense]
MKNFNLPKNAIVNKFIPKSKFIEKSKGNTTTQQEFTNAISRITWAYNVSEKTINISGTQKIEELQIFNITLKNKEIPKNTLKVIDKAIPSAILYLFEFENDFSYGITIKENTEQRYFFSEWNEELNFDFTGNTIEHIYQKIITLFIQYQTELNTENESFENIIDKEKQLSKLEKEIASLQKKIYTEKQFNKQVAFNKTLRNKLKEIAVLKKQ